MTTRAGLAALLLTLTGAVAAGACSKGKLTPAPAPLRPDPKPVTMRPPPGPTGPEDCQPSGPGDALPALTFDRRSIPEAQKLASDGLAKLQSAEVAGIDPATREQMITDAVDTFINALLADPYNVDATYNLAAAYARIDRRQCAINLLERLIQMREHPSKKDRVEEKLDRLLGRNKKSLDPDFNDMRGDERFRSLIRSMCAGTQDPGCVFGT